MSNHMQESTTFSLTDTVVGRHDGHERPHLASAFSENNVPSPTCVDSVEDPRKHNTESAKSAYESETSTIPSRREFPSRTLIVCFDGTGDQFDKDNSNVVKFVSLLKKGVTTEQMVYYQSGIGTYTSPLIVTPLMAKIAKTLDMMFAWNLDAHIIGGYEFLMQNYTSSDKICIFGFSRGAHTARSLAGMIRRVGLLTTDNFQQVPFAYKLYAQKGRKGASLSKEFRETFSIEVNIDFLGVWDTVSSVGLIPKRLPFTAWNNNKSIINFRHAISLDERRAKFRPKLCKNKKDMKQKRDKKQKKDKKQNKDNNQNKAQESIEKQPESTNVKEVWFAGCHSDVGGGSVVNRTRNSLARIPLRWMIRECFKCQTGILFLTDKLRGVGLDPETLLTSAVHQARPKRLHGHGRIVKKPEIPSVLDRFLVSANPRDWAILNSDRKDEVKNKKEEVSDVMFKNEEEEELLDAISPKYDQLKISPSWWILELLPWTIKKRNLPNFARPRSVRYDESDDSRDKSPSRDIIQIHRSVQIRMEARISSKHNKDTGKQYKYKLRHSDDHSLIQYVD